MNGDSDDKQGAGGRVGVRRFAQFFRYLFVTVREPVSIEQMAYDADVTSTTMRDWVSAYEQLGMVRLIKDPKDLRRKLVVPTYSMTRKPELSTMPPRSVPSTATTPQPGPLRLTQEDWNRLGIARRPTTPPQQ